MSKIKAIKVGSVRYDLSVNAENVLYTDTGSEENITLVEKIGGIEESMEEKADLVNGKVPASQLPSYVDDVIEGYYKAADGKFYESKSGSTYSTEITAETGKIYVDLDSNKTFRWSGSAYIEISSGPDIMGASGSNHKSGLVPDTGSTAGNSKALYEDGTWKETYTQPQIDEKLRIDTLDGDGYSYIDLGLPSGTLWATMNVGASSETDYGNYYMYGKGANQYNSSDTPYEGTENPLSLSVDTARQVWGGGWHTPTELQVQELRDNTTYTWETNFKGSNVNGGKFTSKTDTTKYIFFPAGGSWYEGSMTSLGYSGWYYTSTAESDGIVTFGASSSGASLGHNSNIYRIEGRNIRPVFSLSDKYTTKVELNTKQDTINDLSTIRSGAAAGATAYQKPSGGIPDTDLSSAVQTSLGKADTALQSFTETDPVFSASAAAGIQSTDIINWNNKQDPVAFNTPLSAGNFAATMADLPTTMVASGSSHKGGLVPDTPSTLGTTKFLREDGAWAEPAGGGGTSSVMGPSGPNHAMGLTPDTPDTAGTTMFLREDGTWAVPSYDVSDKADKVSGATNGNFAALDSNGNLTDSGHKHSDYLTSHQDLSNYVQKNNTAGLLKNDGTVDTNSYIKTVSGTTGNIITKSSTSGQINVSSYSPSSLISSAQTGAVNTITGQDGDELPTMTLYAIKSYIDSEVARLTALIGGGAKAGWRDCDGLTGMQGDGTKILCDGDGKVVVIDDGKGNAYWVYLDGTDVKSLQYDEYSSDYTTIESYGYGEQTYSYTEDIDPNTGNYVKIFTISDTEYTFDDMLFTISPEVSDWTSGSSSGLVGCPPKWFDLMASGSQYDGSKILVNSDGKIVILNDYQNSNNTYVVLLDTNDEIAMLSGGDGAIADHKDRYGYTEYNDYFDQNHTHKFILNYKEYTIDTQKFTITPSDIEDWPKEEQEQQSSNSDLLWRLNPSNQNEMLLVTNNGDIILIEISNWGYTQYYGVRKNLNNSEIRTDSGGYYNYQSWGWNAENVVGTQNGSVTSFDYNNVTYEVDASSQGSITPDVTDMYNDK